jgi:hypothetical protein
MNSFSELASHGLELRNNEIFSYKKLPIIGGKYEVDNFIRLNVYEHFSVTASLHFQLKDLPDGTRPNISSGPTSQFCSR